jgi:protein-L-isoaspartate(D-aspartate) O-methyltransferase
MTDYSTARRAMVDSQIHPLGVVNERLLEVFLSTPRERFVPPAMQGYAYSDEDIWITPKRSLMDPSTLARLLQAAELAFEERVLDIGCASGYSTAILSPLVHSIVAVEEDASLLSAAEAAWRNLGLSDITPHQGPFDHGCPPHGLYDLILVNGAVATIPPSWIEQLHIDGRLLVVVQGLDEKIGRAIIVHKGPHGILSDRVLFNASVPYLPGLEPRPGFVF